MTGTNATTVLGILVGLVRRHELLPARLLTGEWGDAVFWGVTTAVLLNAGVVLARLVDVLRLALGSGRVSRPITEFRRVAGLGVL